MTRITARRPTGTTSLGEGIGTIVRSAGPLESEAACDRLIAVVERSLAVEEENRRGGDATIRVPLIRFALALLRMRVRPALEPGWLEDDPVHVAMFGGTNSGKSTVLNVLLGRAAAGM